MKRVFLCVVIFNVAFVAYSQDLLVAVTDFTARSSYSEEELANITELFATFLQNTGKVKVLTRNQWEAILKEHTFQRGGLVAQTEIRQLGQALGAQGVVTGTMMKMGNINVLNINILDIVSGQMLSAAVRRFESLDEFLDLLPALANDVIKLLPKPHPLIGRWKANDFSTIIEFYNKNIIEDPPVNFIIREYFLTLVEFNRNGRPLGPSTTGSRMNFNGNVVGTFSFTDTGITAKFRLVGKYTEERLESGSPIGNFKQTKKDDDFTSVWITTSNTYRLSDGGNTLTFSRPSLIAVATAFGITPRKLTFVDNEYEEELSTVYTTFTRIK